MNNQPITRQAHGAIDYAYANVVAVLPELAGFENEKKAAAVCRILAGGALTYSLLTKAEWGAVKLIPFKKHLMLDTSASIFAIAAPWLLGFAANKRARNSVWAIGLAGLAASLLTQPSEM
jgi:hypothetical protein